MIYLNPKTGKFHFLPWGADSMFVKYSKIDPDRDVPLSVKTGGLIANRLYETPSARARYLKTLTEILDKHWNEEKLLAEADRIETLLQPYAKDSLKQRRFSRELDKVREFIRNRRKEIAEETADGMPVWTKAPSAPAIIPARRAAFGQAAQDADTLWSAARNGDVEAIEKHLETVPVNARDPLGATALSWAAGLGRVDAVALLIEKGADVNARNRDGNTPLDGTETPINDEAIDFLANMFNMEIDKDEILAARPKIAKLLRKHGALNSAELADKPADIWSAARQGKVEAIGEFLKTGVDIDAKDLLGSTALSWAAALGRIDAVKFLLEKGADIDERNSEGKTPLEGTAKEIDEDAADFLFRFFKVEIDPEKVNAAKPKIAEILRKHGEKK
jgi:ankyrin repeat protein